MKHVIIDIETLDTAPTAVVLEMAMIIWDTETPEAIELKYAKLDNEILQIVWGRTISKGTCEFWKNNAGALQAIVNTAPVDDGFLEAILCLRDLKDVRWYCRGKPFDFAILENYFGIELFNHRNTVCLRDSLRVFEFGKVTPWDAWLLSIPLVSAPQLTIGDVACGDAQGREVNVCVRKEGVTVETAGVGAAHLQHHRAIGDVIKEFAELQLWLSIVKNKVGRE